MHGDGAPSRRVFGSNATRASSAPITRRPALRRSWRGCRARLRLYYNRRTVVDHFEQLDHVLVTHPHAPVTGGRADLVFVFSAMNVDEAVARIRIVFVQAIEPQ